MPAEVQFCGPAFGASPTRLQQWLATGDSVTEDSRRTSTERTAGLSSFADARLTKHGYNRHPWPNARL